MANRDATIPDKPILMTTEYLVAQLQRLVILVNELKLDLNALRTDFRSHDHGNTGSYAQAAITLRGTPNSFTGTAEANSAVATSDVAPIA